MKIISFTSLISVSPQLLVKKLIYFNLYLSHFLCYNGMGYYACESFIFHNLKN